MKKCVITLGAIAITLLMMSTVTAVPQTHSTSMMDKVNELEDKKAFIEEIFSENIIENFSLSGIIDILIQLITILIQIIITIVGVVSSISAIIELIQGLLNAIPALLELINQLLDLIGQIFNTDPTVA